MLGGSELCLAVPAGEPDTIRLTRSYPQFRGCFEPDCRLSYLNLGNRGGHEVREKVLAGMDRVPVPHSATPTALDPALSVCRTAAPPTRDEQTATGDDQARFAEGTL